MVAGRKWSHLLIIIFVCETQAKVYQNFVSDSKLNWVFLDKFVFDTSGQGSLSYSVVLNPESSVSANTLNQSSSILCLTQNSNNPGSALKCFQPTYTQSAVLLFYNDLDSSAVPWSSLYNDNSLTCEDRVAAAAAQVPLDDSGMLSENSLSVTPSGDGMS